MCGICGKLSWNSPAERDVVERMNLRLVHRGPDGSGVVSVGPLTLGHRRLAIIDLTEMGRQPMSDSSGDYWIAFNGEIYNFKALRSKLEASGCRFRSNTDTEVVIESYKQWGPDCLRHFIGMFAFALWDGPARRLLLARDRLGKKPLYYFQFPDGGVCFSSELKSLCEDPGISRTVNPAALSHYLSLNYTLTAESMIYGVHKLLPGHYIVFSEGKHPQPIRFWDLAAFFQNKSRFRSDNEAAEQLRALIDDSVRLRMISDVPLGAFLSGGIDSSSIVSSMCRQRPANEVHSFSVGFKEKSYSELDEARRVAESLGVHHQEGYVHPDAAQLFPRIVYYADEPFGDTSMFPMFLLAEFCRKHVTVCLSGDGGDEIFAGYETYSADKIHHYTQFLPSWLISCISRAFKGLWPVSFDKVSFDYKVRQFLAGHNQPHARAHYHWRTIFSDDEKKMLLPPPLAPILREDAYPHFQAFDQEADGCHYLDRSMYVDIKTWLVDDILVKVDRSTMAHSLEARAPFLDHRIVEFAASLPVDLKMRAFKKKYIFKLSQRGRIPAFVLKRPKRGFNAPVAHWMKHSLRERFYELSLRETGPIVFNSAFISRLWNEHMNNICDHSLKLLSLMALQLWCDEFRISGLSGY